MKNLLSFLVFAGILAALLPAVSAAGADTLEIGSAALNGASLCYSLTGGADGAELYAAVYTEDGNLVSASTAREGRLTVPAGESSVILRAYCWEKGTLRPLTPSAEKRIYINSGQLLSFDVGEYVSLTDSLAASAASSDGEGNTAVFANPYISRIFGTSGWQTGGIYAFGNGRDYLSVFDGNISTVFDGAADGYVGVEFNKPTVVTKIGYHARYDHNQAAARMDGVTFEGSDNGSDWTKIYTLEASSRSEFVYRTSADFDSVRPYKYVRFSAAGNGNVFNASELELYTSAAFASAEDAASVIELMLASEAAKALMPEAEIVENTDMLRQSGSAEVIYTSSDEELLSSTGIVTRPEEDTELTITMNISVGASVYTLERTVTVPAAVDNTDTSAYLFVHFIGDESAPEMEQVYFSVSEDAHNWTMLNGGNPVLISDMGEKGCRDMHIVRSPQGDKFYLIATDLSMYSYHKKSNGAQDWGHASTYGSHCINIWESRDLVNWSEQRQVKVAPEGAGMAWAPESIYDEESGSYLVFWASNTTVDGVFNARIYASHTRDFKTFTPPEIYTEIPSGLIDTTIYREGDTYYRFYKVNNGVNGEYSDSLSSDGWTSTPLRINVCEGPEVFKLTGEDKWALLVDRNAAYIMFTTEDLGSADITEAAISTETRYRHGNVIPITADEYERLVEKYGDKSED